MKVLYREGGLLVLMEMNLYLVVKELISGIGINLSTNLQKKNTKSPNTIWEQLTDTQRNKILENATLIN